MIAGFLSRGIFHGWLTTLNGNIVVGSQVLTLLLVARIFTLLTRFHKAQSGNMCKVDHQALSHVKVLSETHLYG